ncbi:LysR family transcriptional regulator [Rhizobium mongolense]|uniref:DNA-binding transcriptional LysR family regulator n=2 Tax=Rhizobium mongolense TaxID=57676 RepID=A0ABR6IZR9_9HYPH|nr:LysR family transcriptional regulator [Rhizobium mongolense]MBB4233372.1 DNA-binding transcriptional LysR family regulator [Rhizobium mongolense]TVZ75216.1 DNA-binding transcriptional LysR family regulator [Rhizobium mongolense USDA 1844]
MDQPAWKRPHTRLIVEGSDAAQRPQMPNLASVDLNLLVDLEALLRYRNITHAAQHVGRSQPAMSRALSRLRGMFNDDLLVRGSGGLVPTLMAERLAKMLPSVLDAIRQTVNCSVASMEWRWKVTMAMPDHQALVLLPRLLPRLRERAPHLDMVTDPVLAGALRRLEQGEIDLAIGQIGAAPPGYLRRKLYADRFTCLMRHDHPVLEQEWTIGTFAALRHVAVASESNDRFHQIYDVLGESGVPNCDPIVVSNVLTAAVVIAATDLVLIVPNRIAAQIAAMLPLALVDPPMEPKPYEVALIWHERCHRDPGHRWLRREITAAARTAG